MPMKSRSFILLLVLTLFLGPAFGLYAANLWTSEMGTPTAVPAPDVNTQVMPSAYQTATPTPFAAPSIQAVAPTPTPRPGLKPVDPTAAAIFSAIVPGSGQVYAGDPLKGVAVAALFGVGLWQTLDNLSLHSANDGTTNLVVKNEDLGSLLGLATLVVYGFQIQDASDTANHYNKTNYLTFNLGLSAQPNVVLAYRF